jgi:hypothetical protein
MTARLGTWLAPALVACACTACAGCSRGEDLPDDPRPATSGDPVPSAALEARLDLPPASAPAIPTRAAPSASQSSSSPSPSAPGLGVHGVVRDSTPVLSNAGLPPEVVRRIVRQNFGRLRLCYQHAAASDPTLEGSVVVQFVIEPDGSVGSAGLTPGTTLTNTDVTSCVARAFRRLSFPELSAGALAVTYTVYFAPAPPLPPSPGSPALP